MSILRRLRHENIVRYYGATQEGCKLNIILEYVSGGSIHSLIGKFGPLKEELVAVYTRQIVSGLEYLHRHNVVHRGWSHLLFLPSSLFFRYPQLIRGLFPFF
jgi:serine/threonine protein kinase